MVNHARYTSKYIHSGENADAWAYDGPVVWAEGILEALDLIESQLDQDVRTERRPVKVISVEQVPTFIK